MAVAGAPACDITQLKRDARGYAASNQDPIFDIISALQTELRNGRSLATREIMFQGWTRLAAIRFSSDMASNATPAQGNAVARGFLGCADDAFITKAPADASFTLALGPGGMFEVIHGARMTTSTAAYSRGGTETWATHPPAGKTWGQISVESLSSPTPNTPHLIYGWVSSFGSPDQIVSQTSFQFTTSPAPFQYSPGVVRGVCINDQTTYRIQRNQSVLVDAALDCSGDPLSVSASRGPLTSFAYHVMNYLIAQPLQAQTAKGVAGQGSEYSDHVAINVSVSVTFTSQPTNGFVDTDIAGTNGPVAVAVKTAGGLPLANAYVELQVANNSGSTVLISGNTGSTDASGIVTFPHLQLNKAGGYTLKATGAFDNLSGSPTTSVLFNIQNK